MQKMIFLQAALNGDRIHPAAPRIPAAIADAARAAVNAGAHSVHVHAFDDAGREILDSAACAKVLRAIRAFCPGTPISLTTSAAIVADPAKRLWDLSSLWRSALSTICDRFHEGCRGGDRARWDTDPAGG